MELSDINVKQCETSGSNTTVLYENTVLRPPVKRNESQNVEEISKDEGHYEQLQFDSKPDKNKGISQESALNRLKLVVYIMSALVLVLFIAVVVLIVVVVVPKGQVDGKWTKWSDWTLCDVTCGNGTQTRTRSCTNPSPAHGGAVCTGESTQYEKCSEHLSPVTDGGWTNWGIWSTCTVTCGGGIQARTRTCTNPKSSDHGEYCTGDPLNIQSCSPERCSLTDGGWTNWGIWSTCTVTCGGGIQARTRTCTNPKPSDHGEYCTGDPLTIQSCSPERCSLDGKWTNWSDWTLCDVTCGNGTKKRTRSCTNPAPAHGGAVCTGERTQNEKCSKHLCPVTDGGWTNWGIWSTCTVTCGGGIQARTRTCTNPKPSDHGEYCAGDPLNIQSCSLERCSLDGKWTTWSDWTLCDVTCGNGTQTRTRSCSNPAPAYGGAVCTGESTQNEKCSKHLCPATLSAFSVYNPSDRTSDSIPRLTFSRIIYQHGKDFNLSSGTYNCSIPGTYHFAATIVKKRSSSRVDLVDCYLYKNQFILIRLYLDPTDDDTDKGNVAISQSVVTSLDKGDNVYLGRCSDPSTRMEYFSSFTGFLLYPDD